VAVALLDEAGAGASAHREGLVHYGVELTFWQGRRGTDRLNAPPPGKTVVITADRGEDHD